MRLRAPGVLPSRRGVRLAFETGQARVIERVICAASRQQGVCLASAASDFVTGSVVAVDGGYLVADRIRD